MEMTIREFQKRFRAGEFDAGDRKTQCAAGWYGWFCKDSALAAKTQRLGKAVCGLTGSKSIDLDKTYVFFKNNCPMSGPTYDDFRICELEGEQNVMFTVAHKSCHEDYALWTVYDVRGPYLRNVS